MRRGGQALTTPSGPQAKSISAVSHLVSVDRCRALARVARRTTSCALRPCTPGVRESLTRRVGCVGTCIGPGHRRLSSPVSASSWRPAVCWMVASPAPCWPRGLGAHGPAEPVAGWPRRPRDLLDRSAAHRELARCTLAVVEVGIAWGWFDSAPGGGVCGGEVHAVSAWIGCAPGSVTTSPQSSEAFGRVGVAMPVWVVHADQPPVRSPDFVWRRICPNTEQLIRIVHLAPEDWRASTATTRSEATLSLRCRIT
jgi:hypothetical protein